MTTCRVGIGFDAHAFAPDRPLLIGGVSIESELGLAGHSDADVLSHAIADAVLGAAGLGDIGDHFPNDERWQDASSLDILRQCAAMVEGRAWIITNVDATVIAERPRLAPHREPIRSSLASALRLQPEAVSMKASTTDRLGWVGRGEGIAAIAVVLLERT